VVSGPAVTSPREGRAPYLRIEQLSKQFGAFIALRDISLEVFEGEFVCFLGPSGCGKTTLLRAIAGLDIQTRGRVVQAGRDVSALPPGRRDFGIVFQSYALFPNLTVARNVAYGLENRRMGKAETARRVQELLALVGLPEQGPKYPAQLSGGQQQRVALARALATSPKLLLLDEPLSALDAKVRVYLRHEIRELQRRLGVTTIMVTHDQEEALTMADRIVVMNQGVIEQVGSPLDIYRQPASAFVAEFIGTMNFLSGRMVAAGAAQVGEVELAVEAEGVPVGRDVTLAIRPEDISVDRPAAAGGNVLEATVDTVSFLGAFYRVDVVCDRADKARLHVDIAAERVHHLGLAVGQRRTIGLPTEHVRVYPPSRVHG